jgi:hypothetical protein
VKPSRRKLTVAAIMLAFVASFAMTASLFAMPAQATDKNVVQVPPNPASVNDPCGPDNATWDIPADADTDVFDFKLGGTDGDHLIVDIISGLDEFPDGSTTHDYGVAPDSGIACTPETVVIDVPPNPASVNDPCGPDNATWKNVPANTDTLNWAVTDSGHLVVSIVADNTEFPDGSTTHDYGVAPDSGVACDDSGNTTTAHVKQSSLTEHHNDCTENGNVGGQLNVTDPSNVVQDSIVVTTTAGTYTADDVTFSLHGNVLQIDVPLAEDEFITDATIDVNSDWSGQFVLSHYACGETPPVVTTCPEGTTWNDANDNGTVDEGECESTPPPVTCPEGFVWDDLNSNGSVDVGECVLLGPPPVIDHNHPKPPKHHGHAAPTPTTSIQLATGTGGPTGLQNTAATSSTSAFVLAGLLGLLGIGLAGGGSLVLVRIRRHGAQHQ